MDRKSIIGIVLITVLVIAMTVWNQPSKEEAAKKAMAESAQKAIADKKTEANASSKQDTLVRQDDSLKATKNTNDSAAQKNEFAAFAPAVNGTSKIFSVESDLLKVHFSNKGGKLFSVELKKFKDYRGKKLALLPFDSCKFGLNFFCDNKPISTSDLYFESPDFEKTNSIDVTKDSISVNFRLYPENGKEKNKYIQYTYTIKKGSYLIGYDVKFVNMDDLIVTNTNSVDFEWNASLKQLEKSLKTERQVSTMYYKHTTDKEVDYLSETKPDSKSIPTQLDWFSFKQQFFSTVLIPQKKFVNANFKSLPSTKDSMLTALSAEVGLPYARGQKEPISMQIYMGPNKYEMLRKLNIDLERQIPLGWSFAPMAWFNRFIVIPVFNFLEGFQINYGIIILLLTIFVKLLLFPIAYKTYVSSAKMKLLKPEIDEISAKFPKSEDSMKKQQATMALYKKAGVSPLAGCIPMLLQFPILIALFRFFPASFELRQQSFLWASDLSSYDSIYNFPNGFNIPFYGDHISLFTILMTISTLIYTRMNMDTMGSTNQMPGMKTMMYIMPVMFLGIFNNYSSGLSYYYFLANMITFGQQFVIKKYFVDDAKLHRQIQENKKKNVNTKSKFQMKLEEMAKQKGYSPKK